MRIDVKVGRGPSGRGVVQVYGAFEGDARPERLVPRAAANDRALGQLVAGAGFRGAPNETVLVPKNGAWYLVVGLGKAKDLSLERARQLAGTAAKAARARGFRRVNLPVFRERPLGTAGGVAQALIEGALLGL